MNAVLMSVVISAAVLAYILLVLHVAAYIDDSKLDWSIVVIFVGILFPFITLLTYEFMRVM